MAIDTSGWGKSEWAGYMAQTSGKPVVVTKHGAYPMATESAAKKMAEKADGKVVTPPEKPKGIDTRGWGKKEWAEYMAKAHKTSEEKKEGVTVVTRHGVYPVTDREAAKRMVARVEGIKERDLDLARITFKEVKKEEAATKPKPYIYTTGDRDIKKGYYAVVPTKYKVDIRKAITKKDLKPVRKPSDIPAGTRLRREYEEEWTRAALYVRGIPILREEYIGVEEKALLKALELAEKIKEVPVPPPKWIKEGKKTPRWMDEIVRAGRDVVAEVFITGTAITGYALRQMTKGEAEEARTLKVARMVKDEYKEIGRDVAGTVAEASLEGLRTLKERPVYATAYLAAFLAPGLRGVGRAPRESAFIKDLSRIDKRTAKAETVVFEKIDKRTGKKIISKRLKYKEISKKPFDYDYYVNMNVKAVSKAAAERAKKFAGDTEASVYLVPRQRLIFRERRPEVRYEPELPREVRDVMEVVSKRDRLRMREIAKETTALRAIQIVRPLQMQRDIQRDLDIQAIVQRDIQKEIQKQEQFQEIRQLQRTIQEEVTTQEQEQRQKQRQKVVQDVVQETEQIQRTTREDMPRRPRPIPKPKIKRKPRKKKKKKRKRKKRYYEIEHPIKEAEEIMKDIMRDIR
jgi:hypothetical protein